MQKKSLVEILKNSWQIFTKGYRRVFKYLWWFFKKLRQVFPSLETIAKEVKLSKRQVQNALKHFLTLGLIGWVRRPYQSNVYFMPDEVIGVNLKDERSLNEKLPENSHENCHKDCHVFNVASSFVSLSSCTSESPSAIVPKFKEKEKQQGQEAKKSWYFSLPKSLQLKFIYDLFDFTRFGWALKALTEYEVSEVINNFFWYRKRKAVDKPERLIFQLALKEIRGRR